MGFGLPPAGNSGHWGAVTSTLDWCEENYIVTTYIAEFWNAISCAIFGIAMVAGIWMLHEMRVTESREYFAFASIGVIGVGSFLFHATLWFHTQMMDELPMIYGISAITYCMFRIFPTTQFQSIVLVLVFSLYATLVTISYLAINNPVFHQFCVGLLITIMTILSPIQITRLSKSFSLPAETLRSLWVLNTFSVASFIAGFTIWLVDNNFCEVLRDTREAVGYPIRVLTELHSWWHIATAMSVYSAHLSVCFMRMLAQGRQDVKFKWFAGLYPWLEKGDQDNACHELEIVKEE